MVLGILYSSVCWSVRVCSNTIQILNENIIKIINLEVYELANIKSAKKRILVTQLRTEKNKAIKSKIKTLSKKVEVAVKDGDKAVAADALKVASTEIAKACSKGVYHKNTAARKVSRLTNLVNAMN